MKLAMTPLLRETKINNERVHVRLTTLRRPRRSLYWVKECWKPAICLSRFKQPIHLLARSDSVDDIPYSPAPRKGSRKTERSRTWRFHFNVRLGLPGGIFTQNIFWTSFADLASKASSCTEKAMKWSRSENKVLWSSLSMTNVFHDRDR